MKSVFTICRARATYMPATSEVSANSAHPSAHEISAEIVRLRQELLAVEDIRFRYLALVLIVFCGGVIAVGHLDPEFYRSGAASVWAALVLASRAIGKVFVSRHQMKLIFALLMQRLLDQ